MSTDNGLVGRDMRFRVTDKDGKTRYETKRVWDGERFAVAFDQQHRKENGKAEVVPIDTP